MLSTDGSHDSLTQLLDRNIPLCVQESRHYFDVLFFGGGGLPLVLSLVKQGFVAGPVLEGGVS